MQIEHRPMLPLMAFVGKDVSAALTEAAGRVSEQWGPKWVVLLTTREDGTRLGPAARLNPPRRQDCTRA